MFIFALYPIKLNFGMNYNRINNIVGWAVGLLACAVYLMTMEATVSFWDCGEFTSGAAKLEVVHSPGAPLFLMFGRLFVILFGMENGAIAVNTLSALSSGFTILFLFWTITHFAKRIIVGRNETITTPNIWLIMGSGVVGALAYTFSDTFWFSAVEAEVYAMSSFLTALVFWAILKWEDRLTNNEDSQADRWVVLIAFLMGLSIGVHLLNLLTIPAIVMVYYFKRYPVTNMGTFWAFMLGCLITGVVQYGVIQFVPILASKMDILFVNSFGLPFSSGVFFTIIGIAVLCFFVLRWAKSKGHYFVHLGTLCFIFILVGYSTFFQTIIRSNADVPIDMTNPDNAISLIKYLQREQYGKVPLVTGPDYNSQPIGMKDGKMQYWKGPDQYEELGEKRDEYEYAADQIRFFPRIWDGNDPNHAQYYMNYLNLTEGERATGADNLKFFINYQVIQMWWRYFCWNYIGRQNDVQNIMGEPHNGNWLSGIKPIDNMFGRGDVDKMPDFFTQNKARNELYFLPFILGILGLIYQYKNDKRNTLIVGLLFFFTGLAIVLYLNNTPLQPRERDYAYAGATYAFAIWIGLGVMMVNDLLRRFMANSLTPILATVVCLVAVPTLMAAKEWDDHDRSEKTLARATAINFLESCEPNAILFTEGDNDTYPLWYLQEVEGLRNDVRIINISLLGIDWYIDQLRYAINKAAPVNLIWKPESYRGEKRNYITFEQGLNVDPNRYYDLTEALTIAGSDEQNNVDRRGNITMSTRRMRLPVDSNYLRKEYPNGLPTDSIVGKRLVSAIDFEIMPNNVAYKNDWAILNIVAANAWKRPIYFANSIDPSHYEGLEQYLRMEGLAYKLVPEFTPNSNMNQPLNVNTKKCTDLILNTFQFGNADRGHIHFDQTNRRMLNSPRVMGVQLCEALLREGKKAEVTKILRHILSKVSEKAYPIAVSQEDKTMIFLASLAIRAGDTESAKHITEKLIRHTEMDVDYYKSLPDEKKNYKLEDCQMEISVLNHLASVAQSANMPELSKKTFDKVNDLAKSIPFPNQQ